MTAFTRTLAEAVGATDDSGSVTQTIAVSTGGVGVTDVGIRSHTVVLDGYGAVGVTDARTLTYDNTSIHRLYDSVGVTDDGVVSPTIAVSGGGVSVSDGYSGTDITEAVVDGTGVVDGQPVIGGAFGRTANPADATGVSDSISMIHNHVRSVADSSGVGDGIGITGTFQHIRSISEPVGSTDSQSFGRFVALTDSAGITNTGEVRPTWVASSGTIGVADWQQALENTPLAPSTYSVYLTDAVGVTNVGLVSPTNAVAGGGVGVSDGQSVTKNLPSAPQTVTIVDAVGVTNVGYVAPVRVYTGMGAIGVSDPGTDSGVNEAQQDYAYVGDSLFITGTSIPDPENPQPINRVFKFTPPTYAELIGGGRLFAFYNDKPTGTSVLVTGTTVETLVSPDQDQVSAADRAYIGGHEYYVGEQQAALLITAGYADLLTQVDSAPPGIEVF